MELVTWHANFIPIKGGEEVMKKMIVKFVVAFVAFGIVLGGSSEILGLQEKTAEAAVAQKIHVTVKYTSQIQYHALKVTVKRNGHTYKGTVYNSKAPLCYAKRVTNYYSGYVYKVK